MKSEIEMKINIKDVEKHIKQLEEQCKDWKADHKHNIELIKGLNSRIAELKKEKRLLGERCTQLLKDKGDLTDELQELKETLAQTIENDEVAYETLKLHDQEEIGMLKSKITKLEQQIEKMKCCALCNNYNMNYLPYWCRTNCVPTKPYEKCKYWEIKEND